MSNPRDPGPSLTPEKEFCACAAPTALEYLKAVLAALVCAVAGTGSILALALRTGDLWGSAALAIGAVTGAATYCAAGRHRSRALGAIAAAATGLSCLVGFLLARLPYTAAEAPLAPVWGLPVMALGGCVLAYLLAAPRRGLRR